MLLNRADSHTSGARGVRQPLRLPERWQKKDTTANTPNFYTELILWQWTKQNLPERQITKSDNQPRTKTEATKQSQSKPMQTETQAKNLESPDGLETQTAEGELKFAGHSDDLERSICGA